jgi:MFS family permease
MLLWSGEALSQLGSQASTVAFPLLVLALTGSPAKAGIVGLAKWVPLAAAALPAGMVADRLDRKRLMIVSDLVRALLLASIPIALWLGRPPFVQIAAVAFADGCLFTLRYVCERGVLRRVVEPDRVPDAVAQNEARLFAAGIVGPPLGGVLFAAARALPFVADAVSYVASMVTVAATRFHAGAQTVDRTGRFGGLGEGLAWLWRAPFFRTMTFLFAAGNPVFTGLYLLAILLAKRHGASSGAVGAMFAVVGGGGLLGALIAAPLRRRFSPRTALVGSSWLMAGAIPLLFVVHAALLIGLVVAACELPTPMANALVAGNRVAVTPDHLQGRVQAAATLLTMSLAWLGPLAVGFLFQHAGATATVSVVCGWTGMLAVVTMTAPALRRGPPQLEHGPPQPDRSAAGVASASSSRAARL